MKKLLPLLGLGLLMSLGSAHAADTVAAPAAAPAPVVAAPGAPAVAAAPAAGNKQKAQHAKMKACNKDAKDKALKGAERKAFMKDCLRNKV